MMPKPSLRRACAKTKMHCGACSPSNFSSLLRAIIFAALAFLCASNADAGPMIFHTSPKTLRAMWTGESTAFNESTSTHKLAAAYFHYATSGKFSKIAETLANCEYHNPIVDVGCHALLVEDYLVQGNFPALANQELLGHKTWRSAARSSKYANFSISQFHYLTSPIEVYKLPQPSYSFDLNHNHLVAWSKNCLVPNQVEVNINGKNVCFTFDLGSTLSTVTFETARAVKLHILPNATLSSTSPHPRVPNMSIAEASQVRFGGEVARHVYFAVEPRGKSQLGNVLGLDFATHLPEVTFGASGINVETGTNSGRCTTPLAFSMFPDGKILGIVVPIKTNDVSAYAEIDSGAAYSLFLVDPGMVADLTPFEFGSTYWPAYRLRTNALEYHVATRILGVTIAHAIAFVNRNALPKLPGPVVGLAGLPILKMIGLRINFTDHTLCALPKPN